MLALLSIILVAIAQVAHAAFGFTKSSSGYTIDAGSSNPLTFFVQSSSCDITSINFYGTELQSSTASHIGSGLGTATVSVTKNGTCSPRHLVVVVKMTDDDYRRLYQSHLRDQHAHPLLCRKEWRVQHLHGNIHHGRAIHR